MTVRQTSDPAFWDERFLLPKPPFGTAPNAFVASEAWRLRRGASVLDIGAGDGRNAFWLAQQGHQVSALDFSTVGLEMARRKAASQRLALEIIESDVSSFQPGRTWDAVVCTFLHLLAGERSRMFDVIEAALRPSGLLIAEWFEAGNLDVNGPGPSTADRLLTKAEVERALTGGTFEVCSVGPQVLDEGVFIKGPAVTLRVLYRRSAESDSC